MISNLKNFLRPRSGLAALAVLGVVALSGGSATAQGTLSTQGFGYHPGQLSTRAQASGGALAEMDPFSPLNPATPASFGGRFLFFQLEPEYRSVTTGSETERSSAARYPIVFGAMPAGERWVFMASASTFLDRTWATSATEIEEIGGRTVESVAEHSVTGAINDLRLALSWTDRGNVRLGAGIHGFTGRNAVRLSRVFADTAAFISFSEALTLSLGGTAISVGADVVPVRGVAVSVAYRYGARIHSRIQDSLVSAATIPNRLGLGVAYTGIRGTTLAARASHQNWSSLASLGSITSTPADSWDVSVGADVVGPRFGAASVALRGGARSRTLPYQAGGNDVSERSLTAGAGLPLAAGRVIADVAVIRAFRDAGLTIKESAWTISIGLSARP